MLLNEVIEFCSPVLNSLITRFFDGELTQLKCELVVVGDFHAPGAFRAIEECFIIHGRVKQPLKLLSAVLAFNGLRIEPIRFVQVHFSCPAKPSLKHFFHAIGAFEGSPRRFFISSAKSKLAME